MNDFSGMQDWLEIKTKGYQTLGFCPPKAISLLCVNFLSAVPLSLIFGSQAQRPKMGKDNRLWSMLFDQTANLNLTKKSIFSWTLSAEKCQACGRHEHISNWFLSLLLLCSKLHGRVSASDNTKLPLEAKKRNKWPQCNCRDLSLWGKIHVKNAF